MTNLTAEDTRKMVEKAFPPQTPNLTPLDGLRANRREPLPSRPTGLLDGAMDLLVLTVIGVGVFGSIALTGYALIRLAVWLYARGWGG